MSGQNCQRRTSAPNGTISIRPQRSWVEDRAMLDVGVWMRLARRADHFKDPKKAEGSRTVKFAELRTSCGQVSRAWNFRVEVEQRTGLWSRKSRAHVKSSEISIGNDLEGLLSPRGANARLHLESYIHRLPSVGIQMSAGQP